MITNCFICTYFMTFFWYAAQAQPRPAPAPLPPRRHPLSTFVCRSGESIPMRNFCDGVRNCADGSDEIQTDVLCPKCALHETSCFHEPTQRRCIIHRNYVCNETVKCSKVDLCGIGCATHYRCRNGSCISRSTLCDRNKCNGCVEDDEWPTGPGFQCRRHAKRCRLPQQLLWDNVRDCDDGSDVCFHFNTSEVDGRNLSMLMNSTFNNENCAKCLDGGMLIPRKKVCDGVIDCPDLSDECLCEKQRAGICNRVQLHQTVAGNFDSKCLTGQVSCGNQSRVCINRTAVCNGVRNCPSNKDEKFEYCRGTLYCKDGEPGDAGDQCRCSEGECIRETGTLCDGKGECSASSNPLIRRSTPPGYPNDECHASCPNRSLFNCTRSGMKGFPPSVGVILCASYAVRRIPSRKRPSPRPPRFPKFRPRPIEAKYVKTDGIMCDGLLNCTANWADEENCPQRFKCRSRQYVSIERKKKCDGFKDCNRGEDEKNCSRRFYCQSLSNTKVSIPRRAVCDLRIDCDNAEDEKNCTNDDRFYCENGKPLFVPGNTLFDGRADCSDWSDECPSNMTLRKERSALGSRYQLIGNVFLRVLVWIMGLAAILGNAVVIVGECKVLKIMYKKDGVASAYTNHLLVLNLATSDFLMGVYLLALGGAVVHYQGRYCSQSISWLTSSSCTAMGMLLVISSETSTLTMVMLTASRLYAVAQPFRSHHKPTKKTVLLMILCSWSISIIIASLPLASSLQQVFVDKAHVINNPYFNNVVVSFDAAKDFTKKLLIYAPELTLLPNSVKSKVDSFHSWQELQDFFRVYLPERDLLKVHSVFGYYSSNSACFPKIFVMPDDRVSQISLSITIFNFLAFMFIATAYISLATVARSQTEQSTTRSLERKIVRLIITDFCCWVPLCVMVFVNFSGVPVKETAYAVAAIVLMPINSALNPILYSNFIDKLVDKIKEKKIFQSIKITNISQTNVVEMHESPHQPK